jgi:hypothetical protein
MSSCEDTIKYYLHFQEEIKNNMNKIYEECPNKVLKFMLKPESNSTKENIIKCTWSDNIDKKFISKLLKKSCKDL